MKTPEYTELPARAKEVLKTFLPPEDKIEERVKHFAYVQPRPADKDGDTEVIDGVTFAHHFADAPGDYDTINWHYVDCGQGDKTIVFLHGIPDSWYQWSHQMSALSGDYRCVAVDLKGYGQSDKKAGNFTHEACSEQLYGLLQQIGVKQFYLVGHDRGTVQGDFIAANHPDSVLGYARGEQHLYHLNMALAPQEALFRDAPYTGMMDDPKRFTIWVYTWITMLPIADDEMERIIQEFSYPGITHAVPRYFNSSTFRQEWLERRRRLLSAWKCPVMIMQGYESKSQPREFYENARDYIPNARDVAVSYIPGGHFWSVESPAETTEAIRKMLAM
jgi:pimeloyl-ACP methyl ester carboxylesterase